MTENQQKALDTLFGLIENCADFSNGVTSHGTDEGSTKGWKMYFELKSIILEKPNEQLS